VPGTSRFLSLLRVDITTMSSVINLQTLTFNFRYPVLIDAVIQSGGVGFLGTDRSTMSTLARRRVQSWHNGVVRTVKWGQKGADDH